MSEYAKVLIRRIKTIDGRLTYTTKERRVLPTKRSTCPGTKMLQGGKRSSYFSLEKQGEGIVVL